MPIVAPGLTFVLPCSFGLLGACVVGTDHDSSVAFSRDGKASRQESQTLAIAAGQVLDVQLPAGAIRVLATAEAAPSLSAVVTAYGGSRAEADEVLAGTKLDIHRSNDGLRVRLVTPSEGDSPRGLARNGCQADLDIRIPPGARLALATASGDVECDGPFATSRVHSSYGAVRIRNVEGNVDATSSSGNVSVAATRGRTVVAESDYGRVHILDVEATEAKARSSSGNVKLEKVRGERCRASSAYGNVELIDVEGEVEAKLASGSVRLANWNGDRASLSTDYGSVRVERASGSVEAKTSSGEVRVLEFEGSLLAHSSYGSVDVEGKLSSLRAHTSSGRVSARALPGSRATDTWKLSSSYGNVELVLPQDFACRLDARTDYGDVDIDFPVAVQPGRHEKGVVQGDVNGGGSTVELRCSSGDVRVEKEGR